MRNVNDLMRWLWLATLALVALCGCGSAGMGAKSAAEAAPGYSGGSAGMPVSAAPAMREESAGDSMGSRQRDTLYAEQTGAAPADNDSSATADARPGPPPQKAGPVPAAQTDKKPQTATDVPPSTTPSGTTETPTGPAAQAEKTVAGPLLIYTAVITMAVFETDKTLDAAEKLAKDLGGYLVKREDRSITIRVPSAKFDGGMTEIVKLGDLLHREVSVQDVTDAFFDTQTRLRNAEIVRDRLEDLLKKAGKVEEALAVERELERVAGQIELMKGKLKLYRELIAFSTITLNLEARPVEQVNSTVRMPFPWLDQLGLGSLLSL